MPHFPATLGGPSSTVQWATRVSLLVLLYYVGGRLALAMPQLDAHSSLAWAPAGIGLAALLRFGVVLWPGVWLGALFIGLTTGLPVWVAALVATGDTLGLALATIWLRRAGLRNELDRLRDAVAFVLIGAGATMCLSAANATLWLSLVGTLTWDRAATAWLRLWLGDATGALVFGIPLLTFARASLGEAIDRRRWLPNVLLTAAAMGSVWLAFAPGAARNPALLPLVFLPHLLLCWIAARSGVFAVASAASLVCGIALAVTVREQALVAPGELVHGVVWLWGYALTLVTLPLLLGALVGELAANEERWRLALDISDIGVGEWDLRLGRVEFSPRWLAMLGYEAQDFGQTIQSFWARVHPDDALSVQQSFEPLRSEGRVNCRAECRMLCHDGTWRWFELHALVAERSADGEPVRVVSTARDITERHFAREHRQLSESLFEHLHEGLLITDADYRVLDSNPMFSDITGYSREELLGTVPAMLSPAPGGAARPEQHDAMSASLKTDGVWRGEIVQRRRDNELCTLQVTVSAVKNDSGVVTNHVLAISDITVARRQYEQLQRQAHFDELTGLPNRVRLAQMLQTARRASEREGSLLTVCYLDLDHFKPVNDRFGHEAGDRLLVELADRLRRSLRSWAGGDDVVARIGGDEFVLLLRTATLEESRHAVERVLRKLGQPYGLGLGVGPIVVTASIGATVVPFDQADAETLLRHADHAMYGAKQAGRNGYLFFDAEHDRREEAHFVALGRVQEALDANEFCLYFQPKVDMRDGTVLGAEALLRWQHPEQGLLMPAQFLPLIEHTGLSVGVGNWVLKQGIAQLAQWLRLGLDLTLSINVSARHLQEPLFAKHLAGFLAQHQEPVAHRLVIEVLETAALADIEYTCGLMEDCRALGVRFALDDFGTGYSTLTYLKRLPLDMLKIDRSFVINMLDDKQDLAIVEGVIGLSHTFGCSVVAEGVETPELAQRLIDIGCFVGQGNGIAPAMPADQVVQWVRNYRAMPEREALANV